MHQIILDDLSLYLPELKRPQDSMRQCIQEVHDLWVQKSSGMRDSQPGNNFARHLFTKFSRPDRHSVSTRQPPVAAFRFPSPPRQPRRPSEAELPRAPRTAVSITGRRNTLPERSAFDMPQLSLQRALRRAESPSVPLDVAMTARATALRAAASATSTFLEERRMRRASSWCGRRSAMRVCASSGHRTLITASP